MTQVKYITHFQFRIMGYLVGKNYLFVSKYGLYTNHHLLRNLQEAYKNYRQNIKLKKQRETGVVVVDKSKPHGFFDGAS
jgi:hypothetical protein